MKNIKPSHYLTLLLVFFLASCSEQEAIEAVQDEPTIQAFNPNCNNGNCHIGGLYTQNMMAWAPIVESALNCHDESPLTGNCSGTGQTQVKTHTMCWNEEIQYAASNANSNVCQLADWARDNRPTMVIHTSPWSERKWRIKSMDYEVTSGAPCENHCSNPVPITLTVTYEEYKCTYQTVSNHQLGVVTVDVVDGSGGGPVGQSANDHVTMEFVLYPDDPRHDNPIGTELRIVSPDGSTYASVTPTPPNGDGSQFVEFEIDSETMLDYTYIFVDGE